VARGVCGELVTKNTNGLRQIVSAKAWAAPDADSGEPLPFFYDYALDGPGLATQEYQVVLKDGHTYFYQSTPLPVSQCQQQARAVNPFMGSPVTQPRGGRFFNTFLRNTLTWNKTFLF